MLGGLLRDLPGGSATADGDAPGLHGLGDFANEFNPQQTIVERGGPHLDVIGKVELPLEGTRRDALIEIVVLVLVALATFHRQHVLLGRHGDLIRAETSQRQRDLVAVFSEPLDVVDPMGRRVVRRLGLVVPPTIQP
jgi:hypothetical protein